MKKLEEYKKNFTRCLEDKRKGQSSDDMLWNTVNEGNEIIKALVILLETIGDLSNLNNKESDE
jgi:hypothetical protein